MTSVDEIPVATTPPGGWTEWPGPILAGCDEPRPVGAPDMAGWWRSFEIVVGGVVVADHPALGDLQRIEQAGNRVVVTGSGIIHDMRCDGTLDGGVHDVAQVDKTTPIRVIATYEDGAHVLRPQGLDPSLGAIEVRRWREGDQLVWQYFGFTARLERLAPPEADPTTVLAILKDRP